MTDPIVQDTGLKAYAYYADGINKAYAVDHSAFDDKEFYWDEPSINFGSGDPYLVDNHEDESTLFFQDHPEQPDDAFDRTQSREISSFGFITKLVGVYDGTRKNFDD